LIDEPLSHLAAYLRDNLRQQIKALQKNLGIATIYVTHDQKEAMYLADAIAIMLNGNVSEIGSPEDLYKSPRCIETARFLGQLNEIPGIIREAKNNRYIIETPLGNIQAEANQPFKSGERVIACFRPELVQYPADENLSNRFECKVISHEYGGRSINVVLKKNDRVFKAEFSPSSFRVSEIKECVVGIDARDVLIFRTSS
ncbi:MAG: hypothetical protein NC830_07655, partial [Candidatus Omnitrophica bacterium]|nr:hypothetical protein [Candidatus Omnitrophota bacterium]